MIYIRHCYSTTFGTIKNSSFLSGEFLSISSLILPSLILSFLGSSVLSTIDVKGSVLFVSSLLSCSTKFNIASKSFDKDSSFLSSREILDSLLTKIETSANLVNSADDYQKLIKVNNLIEKKFQSLSKEISNNSKSKIDEIIKKNAKKIK